MATVAGGGGSRSSKVGKSRPQKTPNTYKAAGLTYRPGVKGKNGGYGTYSSAGPRAYVRPTAPATKPKGGGGITNFTGPKPPKNNPLPKYAKPLKP